MDQDGGLFEQLLISHQPEKPLDSRGFPTNLPPEPVVKTGSHTLRKCPPTPTGHLVADPDGLGRTVTRPLTRL